VYVVVCVPFGVLVAFHLGDPVVLPTRRSSGLVVLSSFSTSCVGACALLTARLTALLVPLTVAPLGGLVIDAVIPGGGVAPPQVAPDGTTGAVASLLIVTGVEKPQLPAASVATACAW